MATISTIKGADLIMANIGYETQKIGGAVSRGLRKAGILLQRQSVQLVPVDFGPLKASAYTRATGTGFNTRVEVGYTAAYALWVHEKVAMSWKGLPRQAPSKGNYWDPAGKGQAKFLEAPVRSFQPLLMETIRNEVDNR